MENTKIMEKEFYRQKTFERIMRIDDKEKRELLYRMVVILEFLPACECQRILDNLSELYFS